MRKTFYEKLDEISEDVIYMGSLVQGAVSNAVEAIVKTDASLAQKVIDGDIKIDDCDITIEEKCIIIQAEHQPVAKDLRFIHSVSIVIKYLERIGDLSVNIAKITKKLSRQEDKSIDKEVMKLLIEMGNLAKSLLDKALQAFKNKDSKLASRLGQIDDDIDEIQKIILRKLYTPKDNKESDKEDYLRFIANISLVSRYSERIGDQSVNIGERVLYFSTGDYKIFHEDV